MEWDQLLFKKTWDWLAQIGQTKNLSPETVYLEEIHGRLTLLARMLCGEMIEVLRAEQEGAWANHCLFLPEKFSLGCDRAQNSLFYVFRICYLSVQRDLGLNWSQDQGKQSLTLSRLRAQEVSDLVLAELYQRFPAMEQAFRELIEEIQQKAANESEAALLWGHFLPSEPLQNRLS